MENAVERRTYQGAKTRCTNLNTPRYKYYGGRGVEFRFKNFDEFFAALGPKPTPKHSIDRYPDNNGHYEPGNVRWATAAEQAKNRRPRSKPMNNGRGPNIKNRVSVGMKLDPTVYDAIKEIALSDDRSVGNMIERLLRQNPTVQQKIAEIQETETVN